MAVKHKCKITVIKRSFFPEIAYVQYGEGITPCDFYYDGQEFIVDEESYSRMLDGKFCGEAWDCVKRYVRTALLGGTMIGGDSYVACCNDGSRPVMFKLERIDEEVDD